jgi:PTS system N-acetylglucosamine-specific IIC component
MKSSFLQKLQKLGKALMLPIASLPVASLLLRLGQGDLLNLPFISAAGDALFANLPLLFAIGVAVGLAKDNNGAAGLAGAIGFYVMNGTAGALFSWLVTPVAEGATGLFGGVGGFAWAQSLYSGVASVNMAHFGGIIAGVIAGLCYNKYKSAKLPDWLGFFGGRRFVPIVTGFYTLLAGIGFGFVWPFIQKALDNFANFLAGLGALGAAIYGFFNRVLLSVGLHHVLNTYFWFQFGDFTKADGTVVHGDLNRFFALDPNAGDYMAGFFPIMMFALPAVALAIYVCAKKGNKALIGGAMVSVAIPAFLCGITEPIEFMFMFLAPVLFVIHGVLTGVSMALSYLFGIKMGFGFSAGLFDMVLNWNISTKPWLSILIGLVMAAIYFFLFVFVIKKFDLKTPGREDDDETGDFGKLAADLGFDGLAQKYIDVLGGSENIKEIESCITRLRLVLKDNKNVDERALKALGASGVMKAGTQVTQVIVGTKAELLVDAMKKFLPTAK